MAFFSVNNGVLLCARCAQEHQRLSPQVSYVRPVSADFWRQEQVDALRLGGNEKFAYFLRGFEVDALEASSKYRTRAARYYRQKLAPDAQGRTPEDSCPSKEEGREVVGDEDCKALDADR